jgi:hypothetical protein
MGPYSQVPFSQVLQAAMLSQNRRRDSRFRVSAPAVVWPAREICWGDRSRNDALRVVMVESICGHGLSFMTQSEVETGLELWIRFQIGSKTCQLKGVVRHTFPRELSNGRRALLCGVEFLPCGQTSHAQAVLAGYLSSHKPLGALRA